MVLTPGELIKERYRIEELLGQGGMGAVYRGHDTALDAQVAIKTNLNPNPHSERQFIREARLLAALRHPNLPRVTDYFVIEDKQYLVMDYIAGEDLSTRLKRQGAHSSEEVLVWANQLGDALSYLHSQDPAVIHRDIKPSNIKLTPQGQVVLVDFGIAKASEAQITTTGARGYTPGFAPPEQYGSGSTGPFSDQYSLAATLYALLTGNAPAESVERMLGNEALVAPRELNADVPEHVEAALQRALAIYPRERFTSVADFIASLNDPTYSATALGEADTLLLTEATPQTAGKTRRASLMAILAALLGISIVVISGIWAINSLLVKDGSGTGLAATTTALANTQEAVGALAALAQEDTTTPTNSPTAVAPSATPTPTASETPRPTPTSTGGGGLIAFVSNRVDPRYFQIFIMRADGSDIRQLTFDVVSKSQPTWSPDGTKILYVADGGRFNGERLGFDIWVMDADGSNQVNLTNSPGDDYDPAWSPDGDQIAFTSERQFNQRNIHIMNADGSAVRNITLGYASEYSPAWSPDGEWIVYALSIRGAPATLGLRRGDFKDPQPFDLRFREGQVDHPVWSPDGSTIAYTLIDPGRNEITLASFDVRGDLIYSLTNSLGNKEPDWSPDGQWLVFTSTRDLNTEIYLTDPLGRVQTNLTRHEAEDKQPSWQPQVVGP